MGNSEQGFTALDCFDSRMVHLLKNDNHDFLVLGKSGIIQTMFSQSACEIFHTEDIVGASLFELLFHDLKETMVTQDLTSAQMISDCIGETDVLYDTLCGDFPKKVTFSNGHEEKTITLAYQESRENGLISSIMVMITDVTDEEQARLQFIQEHQAKDEKTACLMSVDSLTAERRQEFIRIFHVLWPPRYQDWKSRDLHAFRKDIVEFQNAINACLTPYFSQVVAHAVNEIRTFIFAGDDPDWQVADPVLERLIREFEQAYTLLHAYNNDFSLDALGSGTVAD
ncbi:MAG: hypothetical protein HRU15_16575 [Planctomycetes bacterium]|nr:hypothetical protein [Planctomycetota bacterium]